MDKKKFIFVTFQKEGIHKYPDAPEGVEFLRHPHRHLFHFRVDIEVFHDDRDIELDYRSCEMMADDLAEYIHKHHPERDLKITVSEDGENGAECFYPAIEKPPILYRQGDIFGNEGYN